MITGFFSFCNSSKATCVDLQTRLCSTKNEIKLYKNKIRPSKNQLNFFPFCTAVDVKKNSTLFPSSQIILHCILMLKIIRPYSSIIGCSLFAQHLFKTNFSKWEKEERKTEREGHKHKTQTSMRMRETTPWVLFRNIYSNWALIFYQYFITEIVSTLQNFTLSVVTLKSGKKICKT